MHADGCTCERCYIAAMTGPVIRLDMSEGVERQANETRYSLVDLSEGQIRDLASGYVPRVLQAMAISCLDWQDEDERRARRPEPRKKRKTHAEV